MFVYKTTRNMRQTRVLIFTFILLILLAACTQPEPVRIVVSATPHPPTATTEATLIATVEIVQATDTEEQPSVTPTVLPSTTPTEAGDGRFFGPIVGADYTPPPTSTTRPAASATPLPASATPIPQTPIATALASFPGLNSDQMGLQLYYNVDIDTWWQLVTIRTRATGVGWIKMQANWEFLQPNGPTDFDTPFRLFQSHVQRAHNEGFDVLISVVKAPDWARPTADADGPPSDPQVLANFITFLMSNIGEQTSAIEVWNEPNLEREWVGNLPFSGDGYMQLFRPAYDAIRAYNPNMPIITAGLAPTGTNTELGSIDDRVFLQQMFDAGLRDYDDPNLAIGIHPYSWGNPPDARCCNNVPNRGWDDDPHFFFMNTIEEYRDIMVRNGWEDRQMWATEFGWATWTGIDSEPPEEWMKYNTPEQQAEYTLRAFEIGQSRDYMGPMFLWNLNFANNALLEERNEMVGYSLFVPGLAFRPLYDALVNRPQ
jgi:polysaccharide biosynthesis protein PslG